MEARNVFDTIVNSRIFRETSVILFLNKTDLLREKVLRADTDLAAYFPEFRVSAGRGAGGDNEPMTVAGAGLPSKGKNA